MNTTPKLAIAAAAVGALIGCGTDPAVPDGTPMTRDDAATLTELATGTLSVRGALTDDAVVPDAIVDPGFGDRWRFPRPVYKLLQNLDALPARSTHECVTEHEGWVDADADGIPVMFSLTFGCTDQFGVVSRSDVLGRVDVNDWNDADAKSAFSVDWVGFQVNKDYVAGPKQGKIVRLFLEGSVDFKPYDASFAYLENYEIRGSIEHRAIHAIDQGSLRGRNLVLYRPDQASDPFDAGTVGFAGEMTFERNGRSHGLRVRTDPTLHFSLACRAEHPQQAGWDAGAVVYADGATLRIEYSGCEEMTATLDGALLPL